MGAELVVQAVARMKDMIQQGSSCAAKFAASADQFSRQANSLQTIVERFAPNGNGNAYLDRKTLNQGSVSRTDNPAE